MAKSDIRLFSVSLLMIITLLSFSFIAQASTYTVYDTNRFNSYYDNYYASRYNYNTYYHDRYTTGSRVNYDRGYVAGYVDGYHDGYDARTRARYTYNAYESNRRIYVKYYPVYTSSYRVYSKEGYRYYWN